MSLVLSSVITSGLGFLFWIIAARQYSAAELGLSAAVITVMIFLADFAHLGLRTGLVRFLPMANDARRLTINAYGLSMFIAAIGAIVFVVGLDVWAPALTGLRESPLTIALFVLATSFWVVFLLEDSVLLALRLAPWVPVENGLFGLVKILLLFPLAGVAGWAGEFGIFLAWVVPVFIVVVAVNGLMARHFGRQAEAKPGSAPRSKSEDENGSRASASVSLASGRFVSKVLSYSLLDWAAGIARSAVIGVIPLIVLAELGGAQNAYYFLAWTITYSVYVLSANIGDALVAEASYDESEVDRHTLHSGLLSMATSVPIVVVAVVAAPWILQAFGPEYAQEASTVLRLLLLGAIPNVITRTYIGRLRAEKRMTAVVVFELTLSVSILLVGWLLLRLMGINGLGVTWLLMLTLAAGYVLAVESVWWWGPRLPGRPARWARAIARMGTKLRGLRSIREMNQQVEENLDLLYQTEPSWHRISSDHDRQSVAVAGHDGRPPLRLELARSQLGSEILAKRVAAVAALSQGGELSAFRSLVPYPIDHSRQSTMTYLVESTISGQSGVERGDLVATNSRVAAVAEAMSELHRSTASWAAVDHRSLDRWISRPLRNLGDACQLGDDELVALGRTLYETFEGAIIPSARVHGNLRLENARFDVGGKLTGLVGWEWSDIGPVLVDWGALALSALLVDSQEDLGPLVRRLLDEPDDFTKHPAFVVKPPEGLNPHGLVLFAWLNHLVPELRSAAEHGAGRYWTARHVQPVMARLSRAAPVAV